MSNVSTQELQPMGPDSPGAGHPGHRAGGLGLRPGGAPLLVWIVAAAIGIYAGVLWLMLRDGSAGAIRLAPDLSPLLDASLAIRIHASAAVGAFLLGLAILLLPKGRGLHKPMGWVWVALMATAALSSFFIREMLNGGFSPIHALSAWTVVALPMGIAAIRARNIRAHRVTMTSLFVGGMLIAGLFTVLPGRLMWDVLLAG